MAELQAAFGAEVIAPQATADGVPTAWVPADRLKEVLSQLRTGVRQPFRMLYDLTAIDERERAHRDGQPPATFSLVYRLLSVDRNQDVRIKVPLLGQEPTAPTITDLWPAANWYEREVWDMFGVSFEGHPNLRRILMPPWWEGHPLRKEHPARATELEPVTLPDQTMAEYEKSLQFRPEEWGMPPAGDDTEYMYLNVGPHHPGTHGALRLVLKMYGQEIDDLACDIGYHHRGAEKMGERQSWHSYIPYTDRVDYLGGVMNNFPYVLAVERLAGIEVPDRAKVIRIMMAELYRIISHLVFFGTFAQDLGMMSPVFYMFTDREKAFDISEAVTGARMHPGWFRIGGVADDLPKGWEPMMREFVPMLAKHLDEYDRAVSRNGVLRARAKGVGALDTDCAIAWGATGPVLRATGLPWDFRKMRPYGGYDQFEFDIPTGERGDCYDRMLVRVEEMRQSLRILQQCMDNMPAGPHTSLDRLATPPLKERTLHDIETLITHFLAVSWGPVVPPGEAEGRIEGTKGAYSYYLVSDGSTVSYRTRIRAASFPHIQMVRPMARGLMIPDLIAILASLDFVLADVDR